VILLRVPLAAHCRDNDALPSLFPQVPDVHIDVTAMLTFRVSRPRAIVARKIGKKIDKKNRKGASEEIMKQMTSVAAVFAIAVGCVAHVHAQTYPSRQITMIVPFPAGGPTDTLARILGERMRTSLGQSVIIENITGAGASIGVGRARRPYDQHRQLDEPCRCGRHVSGRA
jgi:hypothetical protein